jgi:hypothetical protein
VGLTEIIKSAWSTFSHKILLLSAATAFSLSVQAAAQEVSFYEGFEGKDQIKNNGGAILGEGNLVKGVSGNAMDCTDGSIVEYTIKDKIDPNQGTVQIWVKPPWGNAYGFWEAGRIGSWNHSNEGVFKNQDDLIMEIGGETIGWGQVRAKYFPYDAQWHLVTATWERFYNDTKFRVAIDDRVGPIRSIRCDLNVPSGFPMRLGWCGWYGSSESVIDECTIFNYVKGVDEIIESFVEGKVQNEPFIASSLPERHFLNVDPNSLVSFYVDAVDPKGDELTIDWTVNHGYVGSGPEFTYSTPLKGTNVVRAKISDGAFDVYDEWAVSVSDPKIVDNHFIVDGKPFLIKGIIYDPSPSMKFGPYWSREPLPDRDEDVTPYMRYKDEITVPDYDGDGIIRMWEVVQYDMELIKDL